MPKFVSREPALWIGLFGAVLVAIVNSDVVPFLSANQDTANVVIAALIGALIRFFVTPVPAAKIGI